MASEWNKLKPAGTDLISDIDTLLQTNNEAIDRLASNYRRGALLQYSSATALTVGIGELTCSNSDGSVRHFRANTTATSIGWADIDTGAEESSKTYYVHAVADADATTFTVKISLSATTVSGATYTRKLGQFYNNASGNIEQVVDADTVVTKLGFPDWANKVSKTVGTVYQADVDGWIYGLSSDGQYTNSSVRLGSTSAKVEDGGTPDLTYAFGLGCSAAAGVLIPFLLPIKSGTYYRQVCSRVEAYIYFVPNL
jgi:hypothetical protein